MINHQNLVKKYLNSTPWAVLLGHSSSDIASVAFSCIIGSVTLYITFK